VIHLHMQFSVEFVPGTNQYWAMRVTFLTQGHNLSVRWGLSSRLRWHTLITSHMLTRPKLVGSWLFYLVL